MVIIYRCPECKKLVEQDILDDNIEEEYMKLVDIVADYFGFNSIQEIGELIRIYLNDEADFLIKIYEESLIEDLKKTNFEFVCRTGWLSNLSEKRLLALDFRKKEKKVISIREEQSSSFLTDG